MEWIPPPVLHFVLLLGSLTYASVRGEEASAVDAFEVHIPKMKARLEEVRKVLLPLPDEVLQEAMYHLGTYLIPLDAKSEQCRNHSAHVFESYLNQDLWALRMVDASSKLPVGVMDGNMIDLGGFEQCISVRAPGGDIHGQHCIVETKGLLPSALTDPLNSEINFIPVLRMDIAFSVCVPSSCSPEDVKVHMDVALNSVNATAIITPYSCSSALSPPFTASEWTAILVLACIAAMLALGTIHDVYCKDKQPLLTAWSLNHNIPRMLDTHSPPHAITCLNGLRVLALGWIMYGHRMLLFLMFPNIRFKTIFEKIGDLSFAPVENTQLAVEIFYLMSGALVTYGYLRYRLRAKNFSVPHFYLMRYLRLTPALAVVVMVYMTLLLRLTEGPLWRRIAGVMQDFCHRNWWSTLLYVNNYVNPNELCVNQSWYLSSDFQLFLFSPLLLIPLHRRPALGLALTALCYLLTTAASAWNIHSKGLRAGGGATLDRRTERNLVEDYIVTHVRAASYLVGIALGYFLFLIKQGRLVLKLSKLVLWAGWLLSTFFILFSVLFVSYFLQQDYQYTEWLDSSYQVLHRHFFTFGVVWVVVACTLGHGGVLDKFLSWSAFTPLARLSYSAFLCHVLVQGCQSYSQRTASSISLANVHYHLFGDFFASYMMGTFLYLAVEAPCASLANLVFKAKKKNTEEECNMREL